MVFSELITTISVISGILATFTFIALFVLFNLTRRKYWHLFNRKQYIPDSGIESDPTTKCPNPNCVRCQLYAYVVAKAKSRFIKYLHISCYSQKVQRISDSFDKVDENVNNVGYKSHLHLQRPTVFNLKKLTSQGFMDPELYSNEVHILKSRFTEIYNEFSVVVKQTYHSHWLENDTPTGKWRVFHLINQGEVVSQNAGICPNTLSTVMSLPSLMNNNVFGNVAFSVIEPGTTISKHYGPTNVRIRCHLGLITPPSFKLAVSDQEREWTTGQCLLFDDSFLHGVQHVGKQDDGPRAVLIVDLWHKGITEDERVALDYIFAPLK